MSKKRKARKSVVVDVPASPVMPPEDVKAKTGIPYFYDVLLFVAAVALYVPTLHYGFVGDDLIYFIGNPLIKTFSIGTMLLHGAIKADYLPLRDISFALDYLLWGANPFGFHLTNVLLYGATAVVVKHLFVRLSAFLTRGPASPHEIPAFLATLLFVVHPTHREVVCAVYNRGALLTVFFSVLACTFFLGSIEKKSTQRRFTAAAFICYTAALLSREYSLTLPLVFVVIVFFGDRSRRQEFLRRTLPYFGMAAFFFVLYRSIAVTSKFIPATHTSSLAEIVNRLTIASRIVLFYILRMVTFFGQFSQKRAPEELLLAVAVVGGALAAAISLRHRRPQLLFGLLFYLACLIPVMNLFKTDPIVAARYAYLPCLGLFFAILAVPFEGRLKILPILAVVFAATWFLLTTFESRYFKNNIAYWKSTLQNSKTPFIYRQLGIAYYDSGNYEQALATLRMVTPPPQDPAYYLVLGRACVKQEDYECAVKSFRTAMKLGATDRSLLFDLVKAKMARGTLPGVKGNRAKKQP